MKCFSFFCHIKRKDQGVVWICALLRELFFLLMIWGLTVLPCLMLALEIQFPTTVFLCGRYIMCLEKSELLLLHDAKILDKSTCSQALKEAASKSGLSPFLYKTNHIWSSYHSAKVRWERSTNKSLSQEQMHRLEMNISFDLENALYCVCYETTARHPEIGKLPFASAE